MKRIFLTTIIGLLLIGSQAFAKSTRPEAEELSTPGETSIQSIEMIDLGSGPCQDWVSGKDWNPGKNTKPDGNYFYVEFGSAVIDAPPGHPNYINSRQNAYVKAMMNAKGKILQYLEAEFSREVTFNTKEGEFTAAKEADKKSTEVPEESALQQIKRKTLSLINATLDEKLKAKGVEPDSNDPADQETIEEAVQEVLISKEFRDLASSHSSLQLKGVRRVFVSESIKEGEQGEICLVALYSPKTMAMADAIFADPSLAPEGTPNKPIKQQIPDWRTPEGVAQLLSTFGTEMLRDENGQFYVVAYAQSAPRTKSKTAQNQAIKKARIRAEAELRTFAQENAALNKAKEDYELAKELGNAMVEYEGGDAYMDTVSSISGPAKISGMRELGVWGAKHPITKQVVIGSIVVWSPDDADSARRMKAELGSKPKSSRKSDAGNSSRFKSDALKAKGSYQGSASGGSSEEDF